MKKCSRGICQYFDNCSITTLPKVIGETGHLTCRTKLNLWKTIVSAASYSFVTCCSTLKLKLLKRHLNLTGAVPGFQRRFFETRSKTYYYDVLGVSQKATQAEIKSAYYNLSKLHHPDISKKDEAKTFSQISEAYEIIGNVKKRRLYDQGIISRSGHVHDEQDYTKPFRQREEFGFERRAPPTGRTHQFNFDEFYRQHYSEAIKQEKIDREYIKYKEKHRRNEQMQDRLRAVATSLMAIFVFVFVFINRISSQKPEPSRKN